MTLSAPRDFTNSNLKVLHTPVTSAPKYLAICTAAEPILPDAPFERFNEKLEKPFLGLESFGEIAGFALFHEANHLGHIQAMERVINHTGVKN
ncbi:hypothetical protein [Cytobacillus oceanisediminis]|uniref:hypothetical protein n=1 Tax=Cytobacillus oceanisediminis TaxID=665099 RepID=UPI003735024C